MELGLKGKISLVTGGSRGIGRAIALALAQEGCKVAVCARGREQLDAVAAAIRSAGGECLALAADATDEAAARQMVDEVVKTWGALHILVNNVGGGGGRSQGAVEAMPEKNWHHAFELNAWAAVRFTLQAIPHMKAARWGRVVTVASVQGREGGGRPWYNMAKSAEISLMKTLAMDHELARGGITFNSVAPGRVLFDGGDWDAFRREAPERFAEVVRQGSPLERAGTPAEVAAVVAFLCSQAASLVNGACVAVDGGESRSF